MPSFDYSYDYPTRSTSPLHFLNPTATMSHLHSHCGSKPSVSAAADISRLLDPSYLPSSSRASQVSTTCTKAYVDQNGDLHDPDYRHFPTQAKQHSLNSTYSASRSSSSTQRRPQFDWELDLDEHALDDEDEDSHSSLAHRSNSNGSSHYYSRYAPSRSWSTSSQRPRDSSFSTASMYTPTSTYYSPTGTASTLPTSYEDDDDIILSESPFEEKLYTLQREKEKKKGRRLSKGDKEKERMRVQEEREKALREEEEEKEVREMREKIEIEEEEIQRQRRKSIEHHPSTSTGRSWRSRQVYDLDEDDDAFAANNQEEEDDSAHLQQPALSCRSRSIRGAEGDYTPTCTQSLKRQWQAFALGFRFGVFRAQRRMTRRVASLM